MSKIFYPRCESNEAFVGFDAPDMWPQAPGCEFKHEHVTKDPAKLLGAPEHVTQNKGSLSGCTDVAMPKVNSD